MRKRILAFVLVGLALAMLTAANYQFARMAPGGNDFLPRWLALRLWLLEGRNPYAPEVTLAIQRMIYGRPALPGEDVSHFVYPLYVAVVLAPFSLLPYTLARALWMTVLELSLVGLTLLSVRWAGWRLSSRGRLALVLWVVLGYHGLRTVVLGQYAGWNAFLMAAALVLLQARRDVWAGVLLALSTVKPQMAFLLVPWLLLWAWGTGRRSLIGSTIGTLVVLWGVSFALLPPWLQGWLQQVMEYPSYTGPGSPLTALAAWLPLAPEGQRLASILLHAAGFLYLLHWWKRGWKARDRRFLWVTAMTLFMTNLLGIRTGTTHALMLLPAVALIGAWYAEQGPRKMRTLAVVLGLLGIGEWGLFAVTLRGNAEHPVMFFPLPLAVWAGLERMRPALAGPEEKPG